MKNKCSKAIIKLENDLSVDLNGLLLKNPVTVASGTFGNGREYADYLNLNNIGAISVKGLTLEERIGNPGRRIVETRQGMLNSVGLQNQGVDKFLKEDLPWLKQFDCKVIANINGNTIEEYTALASRLKGSPVDSIELNISCPNVKNGGLAFGTDPKMVAKVVRAVRKATHHHLIVKLSPNVTNIGAIAKVAEQEGADCLSLINTLAGMAIDIHTRKPYLQRQYGGYSGPAIKPVALKMVRDVYNSVAIPVLGMGGICGGEDAIEFILAGASAIAIGTENFKNPLVTEATLKRIDRFMTEAPEKSLKELVGQLL